MTHHIRGMVAGLLTLSLAAAGAGQAEAMPLGTANTYGEFVFGNSTRQNVDARGTVAVGGSATFTNFGMAKSPLVPVSGTTTLAVGGSLAWTNGQLFRGNGLVGGAAALTNVGRPNGSIVSNVGAGNVGVDFAAEQSFLLALSAAQVNGSDPTVTPVFSALTFDAANPGLNAFNVTAANFTNNEIRITNLDMTKTVVINVSGSAATFNRSVFINGTQDPLGALSSRVLFNFYEASTLTMSGLKVNGSILAPGAAVSFSNGQINGNLIAASLVGGGETHIDQNGVDGGADVRFGGALRPVPVVPEPASVVLLGLGALGLAAAARRRAARS